MRDVSHIRLIISWGKRGVRGTYALSRARNANVCLLIRRVAVVGDARFAASGASRIPRATWRYCWVGFV